MVNKVCNLHHRVVFRKVSKLQNKLQTHTLINNDPSIEKSI